MNEKLSTFNGHRVQFVETSQVSPGVVCTVYECIGKENECDLGIVSVAPGQKTPLQQVCKGIKTIENYVSGQGRLEITRKNGSEEIFNFPSEDISNEIEVAVGDKMQWHATGDSDLVFAEICYPPYEEGRFKDL